MQRRLQTINAIINCIIFKKLSNTLDYLNLNVIINSRGDNMNEIKDILKKLRKENKYTQQQIADKLCISRAAYSLYETGTNTPTIENILKLAEIYKVSTDYLLGRYKKN